MQLFRSVISSLAVFAIALCFTTFQSVTAEKPITCCKVASTMKIDEEIIGFRFQKKNLPCIAAVIFQTAKGEMCSHWQQPWVREIIRDFKRKQAMAVTAVSDGTEATTNTSPVL